MSDQLVNNGKTVATKNVYSDMDITMRAHPVTGDVTLKTDTDAIRRAVRNIVLTNKYERPFKPNFGGSIRDMLFELDTDRKINRMQKSLKTLIEKFEPRVKNVTIRFDDVVDNSMDVTIFYNISDGVKNQDLTFTVTRAR
jgi:phage baseplate assembly protein W|tara:strand:- start:10094 stop:10513 length:420 start_codon:yes stop_codon:yes gene_type:complete